MKNKNLRAAQIAKNDEFYTRYTDIENEVSHYTEHFKGKSVYCNCDVYGRSNFIKYFKDNFKELGLRKLYATGFYHTEPESGEYYEYDGNKEIHKTCNGDFKANKHLLLKCDIICTNPPFSLFRVYMEMICKTKKDFSIIGNMNAVTYANLWDHVKSGRMLWGYNQIKSFENAVGKEESFANIVWWTSLPTKKEPLVLTAHYNPKIHLEYDNYPAINCDRIKDIPMDYNGEIGVPITIMQYVEKDGDIAVVKIRKGNNGKDLSVRERCSALLWQSSRIIGGGHIPSDWILYRYLDCPILKDTAIYKRLIFSSAK